LLSYIVTGFPSLEAIAALSWSFMLPGWVESLPVKIINKLANCQNTTYRVLAPVRAQHNLLTEDLHSAVVSISSGLPD
jgi:hypothetical protein